MIVVAQSTGQVTAITLITALLVLYFVSTIFGMFRRPSMAAVFNMGVLLGAIYVGWAVRGWPGIDPSEGMLLGLFHVWLDSLRTIWDLAWNVLGFDSIAERIGMSGQNPVN
jgi:uncharacterized membrane protein